MSDRESLTNEALSRKMDTTPRQISKSRKCGYITTNDGARKKYRAPQPVFLFTSKKGKKKNEKSRTSKNANLVHGSSN